MKLIHSKPKQILLKSLSAFLVVWLSGVLVFICCGTMTSKVETAETVPQCHKKQQTKDTSNKFSEPEKEKIDCCIFKPQKTLSADLQNKQDIKQPQAFSQTTEMLKLVFFSKQTYKYTPIYQSVTSNRRSNYLQNCNFRI